MKKLLSAVALALVALLALAPAAWARSLAEDKVVIGDSFTLSDGEVVDGNLIVLGGSVTVEDGAEVAGDTAVFGGNVTLGGTVQGDLVVFGGNAELLSTAVVEGELVTSGGSITREAGSEVQGGETQSLGPRFWDRPFVNVPSTPGPLDLFINFLWDGVRTVIVAFVVAVLALLVALLLPEQTGRVSAAIATAPIQAGFLGLLTLVAVPVLAGVLALVTLLCLSPVSLVALIAYAVALLFGWLALGALIGERLAAALKLRGLSPILAAAAGTLLVTLVVNGIGLLPFVGWLLGGLANLVLSSIGLGAVVLTRFGMRPYFAGAAAPAMSTPPLPPEPPAEAPPAMGS